MVTKKVKVVIAIVVAAIASVNVYIACDIREQKNLLTVLEIENFAGANETLSVETNNITNTLYEPKAQTAVCYKTVVETKTTTNEGNTSLFGWLGAKRSGTTTTTITTNYYVYPCLGSSGNSCVPTYVNY